MLDRTGRALCWCGRVSVAWLLLEAAVVIASSIVDAGPIGSVSEGLLSPPTSSDASTLVAWVEAGTHRRHDARLEFSGKL